MVAMSPLIRITPTGMPTPRPILAPDDRPVLLACVVAADAVAVAVPDDEFGEVVDIEVDDVDDRGTVDIAAAVPEGWLETDIPTLFRKTPCPDVVQHCGSLSQQ